MRQPWRLFQQVLQDLIKYLRIPIVSFSNFRMDIQCFTTVITAKIMDS